MVKAVNAQGWDAVAMNQRGCSGEPNRLYSSYHSGKTDDIQLVVEYLLEEKYKQIYLVGYSLGGNIMLKYAGEQGRSIPSQIIGVAGISVPCDLAGSAQELRSGGINYLYLNRLLKQLKSKAITKKARFSEAAYSNADIRACRNFEAFDDLYTAPAHGYKDAADYYSKCSSAQFIPSIRIPAYIINALDDPFLSISCYPVEESAINRHWVVCETPRHGGHVGFAGNKERYYESQIRERLRTNSD